MRSFQLMLFVTFVFITTECEQNVTEMVVQYDVIVVGLGASGVMAATTLAQAGKHVLGIEAQNRIGGRVHTVPFGEGVVEIGAEWIHGDKVSHVYDIAIKNNITVLQQDLTVEMFRSDGTLTDRSLVNELLVYCFEVIENAPSEDRPLGQYITGQVMEYIQEKNPDLLNDNDFVTEILEFMNLMINNYEASNDWNDVTTASKYEELEGYQHWSWHRYGYKTFLEILLNKYNNGPGFSNLETKLNTEVVKIIVPQQSSEPVVITTKDGASYTANNAIVTLSVGVLKERYETMFTPPLPEKKIDAIRHIPIGVMDKIILSFDEIWWPRNLSFFGFLWKGEDKKAVLKEDYWTTKIFAASCPMGSHKVLTLWTSGEVAKMVETLPEDVVKVKSVQLLQKFMGKNITVPEPTAIIRSMWYTNQFTRGSYSYDGRELAKYPQSRADLASPLLDESGKPRVLFAGEATNEFHFSTVHGAAETGHREAMRLLPHSKM